MAEYIEREAAINRLFEAIPYHFASQTGLEIAINYLREIPAADVQLVRRGKWENHGWSIRCSVCGYDMPFAKRNFCHNCGADMRGGEVGE